MITEDDLVDPAIIEYEAGSYSPQLIRMFDLPPDTIIFDPEDDMKRLEFTRHQIIVTGQLQVCPMSMNYCYRSTAGMSHVYELVADSGLVSSFAVIVTPPLEVFSLAL